LKISCPACEAKYSIAEEKVQDRLAKIRCRKCGTTIVIDGKVTPPNVYAGDSGAAPQTEANVPEAEPVAQPVASADPAYSVDLGDGNPQSMTLDQVVAAYNSGQVTAETYIWADGMSDWTPLGSVPGIVEALHAAAAPSTPDASSPWSGGYAAPAASPAAGAGDLFGGIAVAGSEDDVTTSAPQEAVLPNVATTAATTGARNESSVLFSLSALTSSAASSPMASASIPPPAPHTGEDSGLIDLKALKTAAATKEAAAAPAAVLPLGVSPLGISPLGGPSMSQAIDARAVDYPAAKSNKTALVVAGVIGLGLVAVAAALLLRPAAPEAATTGTAVAPSVVTVTVVQTAAAPVPVEVAKPPATGAEEDATKKPGPAATGRPKSGGATAKPGGSTSSGSVGRLTVQ
jgi:predicted Zn finger-like uncharacterized protein